TLGERYEGLGLYDASAALLERALETRREALGPAHRDTLTSMTSLALVRNSQGKPADALPLAREAADASRRTLGPDDPTTLNAVAAVGSILLSLGKADEAAPLFAESLDGWRRARGQEASRRLQQLQPERVGPVRRLGAAEVARVAGGRRVHGDELAVRHRQRIAEVAGGLGHGCVVSGGRDRGQHHRFGIHARRPGEPHQRAAGGGAELLRVGGEVLSGLRRVLAKMEEAGGSVDLQLVGVQAVGCVVRQVRIVLEAAVGVGAAEFVASDVVQRLLGRAVLVDLPGQEVVERVRRHRGRVRGVVRRARLREDLGAGERRGLGRVDGLARVREGLVAGGRGGCVALLVALQVVPLGEDHAAEAVEGQRGDAARRVLEHLDGA
ncbi:MAG: tetratricopeptide repeat-containing protein, partial [Thermoleophilia bacterium]|nr:tetratricopeptide repeat-containing protein [Thermoleophilia bacterium]